ncbi:hypothetical protein WDZ92_35300 [Nostoc sp. NIES-2111]
MSFVDLDCPTTVSLRDASLPGGRTVTVFAGTYSRALMIVAAMPFPMRDRVIIKTQETDVDAEPGVSRSIDWMAGVH